VSSSMGRHAAVSLMRRLVPSISINEIAHLLPKQKTLIILNDLLDGGVHVCE
jgi:hypothetical protein